MFQETEVTRITIRIILTIFCWHSSKIFTFFLSSLSTFNPNLHYVWQFGAVLMWDHDRRVTPSKFTRMVDLNGSGSLGFSWIDAVKGSFLTRSWAPRIISSSSFLPLTQTKKVHSGWPVYSLTLGGIYSSYGVFLSCWSQTPRIPGPSRDIFGIVLQTINRSR